MRRVGNDNVRLWHPLVNSLPGHLRLKFPDSALYLRATLGILVLVLHFPLGHSKFFRHRPALERNVDNGKDRKSTRLNSSHVKISYAVFCLKKKKTTYNNLPA